MQFGAVFPQTEIEPDPGAIKAYAQSLEEMGFDYILAFDHVLGAGPSEKKRPYTHKSQFMEPFALFAFLAGVTTRIGFATGIVILPQRQTALVAKQAAVVDVLSGGRLRVGVGIGWNDVEYEALGEDFHNRGRRCEEQIEVLRALWTQELVTFKGRWHTITSAGINPLPVQRPIPIWIGGSAEPVMKRVGRLGDGWMAQRFTAEDFERIKGYARAAGRDPSKIGLEGRVSLLRSTPDEIARQVEEWRRHGASHVCFHTRDGGFKTAEEHVAALRRVSEIVKRG